MEKKKMSLLVGAFALVLLGAGCSGTSTDTSSNTGSEEAAQDYSANFTFEQGNYSMYFPWPPSYVEGTMALSDGSSIPTYLYQYTDESGSIWQSGFAEYPETADLSDVEVSLERSIAQIAENFGGEIESVEHGTYQGYPSADFKIYISAGGYYIGRHVLNGHRFYNLGYAYDFGAEMPSEHFFNSLVIN